MPANDFQAVLVELGISQRVVEFSQSTRSAQQAAEAIGVEISQIVKSLVFRTINSNQAVMVLCSGSNQVDLKKIASALGEEVTKADAGFVREKTGYSIGGVPPFGHSSPIRIFIDQDLQSYPEIWAAAGAPNRVFPLTPFELGSFTYGMWLSLRMDPTSK